MDWEIKIYQAMSNFILDHNRVPSYIVLGESPLKAIVNSGSFDYSSPDELREGIYGYFDNIMIEYNTTLSKERIHIK